ncbi:hypothetical protein RJT34_32888 [Clitoria ternatea]|uniref:Uncharacterized protein n=1 Tax=Clitoria ternatea TaxID=43366 RepID=A0AAN9I6C0_CLITE
MCRESSYLQLHHDLIIFMVCSLLHIVCGSGLGRPLHPDILGEPAGMLVNTWVHMAWERLSGCQAMSSAVYFKKRRMYQKQKAKDE